MHPDFKYAQLQTIQKLRAECLQRVRGLDTVITSVDHPATVRMALNSVLFRLERYFRTLGDEVLAGDSPQDTEAAEEMERATRHQLAWVCESLAGLSDAVGDDDRLIRLCQDLEATFDRYDRGLLEADRSQSVSPS